MEKPGKEITKGYRWVAAHGCTRPRQMLANYRVALKNPAVAHPYYKRVDVQRKTLYRMTRGPRGSRYRPMRT